MLKVAGCKKLIRWLFDDSKRDGDGAAALVVVVIVVVVDLLLLLGVLQLDRVVVGSAEPLVVGLQPHRDALTQASGVPAAVHVDENDAHDDEDDHEAGGNDAGHLRQKRPIDHGTVTGIKPRISWSRTVHAVHKTIPALEHSLLKLAQLILGLF